MLSNKLKERMWIIDDEKLCLSSLMMQIHPLSAIQSQDFQTLKKDLCDNKEPHTLYSLYQWRIQGGGAQTGARAPS